MNEGDLGYDIDWKSLFKETYKPSASRSDIGQNFYSKIRRDHHQ